MSLFGLFGPPNVEELKAKGDVNGLIRALSYNRDKQINWQKASAEVKARHKEYAAIRQTAAEALGQIRDERAAEPLVVVLKDTNNDVRKAATKALVKLGTLSVAPLVAALKDKEKQVREEAAETLGQIRDPQAVEPLVAALKDKESWVREKAIEALGQIGDARAMEPLVAIYLEQKAAAEAWNIDRAWTVVNALRKVLENSAPSILPKDLQAVAHLNNIVVVLPAVPECRIPEEVKKVDCAQIKQLARQELIRRGLEA